MFVGFHCFQSLCDPLNEFVSGLEMSRQISDNVSILLHLFLVYWFPRFFFLLVSLHHGLVLLADGCCLFSLGFSSGFCYNPRSEPNDPSCHKSLILSCAHPPSREVDGNFLSGGHLRILHIRYISLRVSV